MTSHKAALTAAALALLTIGSAHAGPCGNAKTSDAGSGPTPGSAAQTSTTGAASATEHPPTNALNRAAAGSATSSDDARRQTQGQPTAAQQAQGAKTADQGC
jgi:hypothetical protein